MAAPLFTLLAPPSLASTRSFAPDRRSEPMHRRTDPAEGGRCVAIVAVARNIFENGFKSCNPPQIRRRRRVIYSLFDGNAEKLTNSTRFSLAFSVRKAPVRATGGSCKHVAMSFLRICPKRLTAWRGVAA